MLLRQEVKELRAALNDMPEAATAAALAAVTANLIEVRSEISARKESLRLKNIEVKALRSRLETKHCEVLSMPNEKLSTRVSDLEAELADSTAELSDAHAAHTDLEDANSRPHDELRRVKEKLLEVKERASTYREHVKTLRKQRQRDGAKWGR